MNQSFPRRFNGKCRSATASLVSIKLYMSGIYFDRSLCFRINKQISVRRNRWQWKSDKFAILERGMQRLTVCKWSVSEFHRKATTAGAKFSQENIDFIFHFTRVYFQNEMPVMSSSVHMHVLVQTVPNSFFMKSFRQKMLTTNETKRQIRVNWIFSVNSRPSSSLIYSLPPPPS